MTNDPATPKTSNSPAAPSHSLGAAHWGLRGLMVVVIVASLVVWALQRGDPATAAADDPNTVVVTLDMGPLYGGSVLFLGGPKDGKPLADAGALRTALAAELANPEKTSLTFHVSGGVPFADLERAQAAAVQAWPSGKPRRILIAPLPSPAP